MGIKVSVITVNLNNKAGLKRTFESVISQDLSEMEYLVIDGGSTDGSKEFIEKNSNKISFWLSEKDSGVYEAMNKGIKNSTGDYLIFLNSGDTFSGADSVAKLISNSHGEDLVYGNILVKETDKSWIKQYPKSLNFRYFYFESLPHPATLISKALFDRIGFYDTQLKIVSDWKFFLMAIVKYQASYLHVNQIIAEFSFDGLSSDPKNISKVNRERKSVLSSNFFAYYWMYKTYLFLMSCFKSQLKSNES